MGAPFHSDWFGICLFFFATHHFFFYIVVIQVALRSDNLLLLPLVLLLVGFQLPTSLTPNSVRFRSISLSVSCHLILHLFSPIIAFACFDLFCSSFPLILTFRPSWSFLLSLRLSLRIRTVRCFLIYFFPHTHTHTHIPCPFPPSLMHFFHSFPMPSPSIHPSLICPISIKLSIVLPTYLHQTFH